MLQRREEFVIDLIRDDREARPFWKSVHAVRAAWGITPRTGLPTYTLNDAETIAGLGVGAPPVWPAEPPLRPVVKPLHPDLDGQSEPLPLDLLMHLPPEWGQFGSAWWLGLKHLHDWFIPPKCQTLSQHPEQAWAPFLSQRLLFDPPRDRLPVCRRRARAVRPASRHW